METSTCQRSASRRRPNRRYLAGVTLIELVVTIAIVAILITIAGTSFSYITNSNRIAAEVNGLLGDMQLARIEAIKEGLPVTVCTSTNGTSCAGVTNWHSGWIVFADANGNATVDAGTDTVLRVQPAFSSTDTFIASNNAGFVTFNREGFASGVANGTLISLHDSTANINWTRCLAVNRSGMMVTQKNGQTVNGVTCS